MKTCPRFEALRNEYQQEISFMSAHSQRHAGKPAAKTSGTQAISSKARMARALSSHLSHCPLCGWPAEQQVKAHLSVHGGPGARRATVPVQEAHRESLSPPASDTNCG